jgi:uncharacterized protein (TIGR03437 family)
MRRILLTFCLLALPAAAQLPFISGHGIRNAASAYPPGLANSFIAQGSIFTIFGTALGPATGVQVGAFPLQTSLAGVSITATQGKTTVNVIPIFVLGSQINAIMPSNAPLGRVSLQVTYNGKVSNYSPATVVASSFGAFAVNGAGFGPGIVTNYVSAASQPVNAPGTTATPGQLAILWGTGLGAVPNDTVAPSAGNLPATAEVFVGGVPAAVSYSGRSPCCSGLDEIFFTVPAGAPMGCYVPVVVRLNGTLVDNAVTMAIAPNGAACSDSNNAIEQSFIAGKSAGIVDLVRVNATVGTTATTADYAQGILFAPAAGPFFFEPLVSLPPLGSCTVYSVDGKLQDTASLPGLTSLGSLLDAGPQLSLATGSASATVPALVSGTVPFYQNSLGGNTTLFSSGLFFSPPSAVTISAPGGGAAGAFQASVPTAASLQWSNQSALAAVLDHTQPLTVTWTASNASGGTVVVAGGNFDALNNASTMFLCAAPAAAGTFTVPALVQANIPATRSSDTTPNGSVFLGLLPLNAPTTFSASGLAAGYAAYTPWTVQSVSWK